MTITINNTEKIVSINGVPARVWEGQTDTGISVTCLVTRIAVSESEPAEVHEDFARQLQETRKPSAEREAWPLRLVL